MRKIDFQDWRQRRKTFLRTSARLGAARAASRRPRDEEEREILLRLDRARLEGWLASGRLVRLGPRHFRFNLEL